MFHIIFRPRMSAAIIIIQILVVLLGNPVGTKISFILFTVEYSSFCVWLTINFEIIITRKGDCQKNFVRI